MISGYLLFLSVAFAVCWIRYCHSHVIPRGLHLSRSCQPQCHSGKSCVIYRTPDGPGEPVCVWLDPHSIMLDGTFITPVETPRHIMRPSPERRRITSPTEHVPKQPHRKTTTNIKAAMGRPKVDLINRVRIRSQNLRETVLNDLDSLKKMPTDSHSGIRTNQMFQNKSSARNSDLSHLSHLSQKLAGMAFFRDNNGTVSFRRTDDVTKQRSGNRIAELHVTDVFRKTTPSNTRMQHASQNMGKQFTGDGAACISCDPDHPCPSGMYCYFSSSCAKQICQHL